MYTVIVAFDVRPERREDFAALVSQHVVECLQAEAGLHQFWTFQDETDENRCVFVQRFTDRAAAGDHQNSLIVDRNFALAEPMLAAPPTRLGSGFE